MPYPNPTVHLELKAGTLYAIPNGGHLRVLGSTVVTITASFPFTVEVAPLTDTTTAPDGGDSCSGAGGGQTFPLHLPDVPYGDDPPPSFKYTIKGRPEGEAAGKVLDPIIIVDKKPH